MTGLDCLREELLKKGFNKSQVESKVVVGVLEVISESNGKYTDMAQIEHDLDAVKKKRYYIDLEMQRRENRLELLEKELQDYIDAFYKALEECETPEGRDRIKAAQLFINSIDVTSKYSETAKIIALGAILSGGGIAPMKELKKINPKLFDDSIYL